MKDIIKLQTQNSEGFSIYTVITTMLLGQRDLGVSALAST